jgi:peptide/nickel transport system substrate-binding protein
MKNLGRPARGVLAVGVAAAVAAGLTACNGSDSTPSGGADATLVVGITADPTQMVPWTSTSLQSQQVLSQIYTPLLGTDEDLVPAPGIADLPSVSDDGRTYTFKLQDGLKFADGSALDSEDVKYTFDKIMDPDSKATSASYFASVASIDAPDPLTVVAHLKQPDASFPAGLTAVNTGIVPSDVAVASLEKKPDGAGPYQFESRVPNESITLERNASYFAGKPGVAKLQFRIIPEESSIVSALRTGSVQLAIFDNPVTAKSAASGDVTSTAVDSLWYHVLQLRASSPVLSDVNTRLAIQCAISRSEVIDSAALGAGEVTGPITSPEYRSDPEDQPCPDQDLDKAKEYLAKAGTPDGFTLNVMTSQGLYSTAVDEAQSVQAQLAKVGIKVNVQSLDSNTYVQRWLAGDFDAAIAQNSGSTDPNTMYARYFTTSGSFNKVAGYGTQELDKLFAQGIATTDVADRKDVYDRISSDLVDNAAWVWLFTPKRYIVANKAVEGLESRTDADISTLWKATLS